MRRQAIALAAAALILAPLGARAADLVVWWEKGFYPQEDAAVAEIIAAFEQKTGKQVELVQPTQDELLDKAQAALESEQLPDFLWGTTSEIWIAQWAYEDRLVDLGEALAPVLDLFDADAIEASTLLDGKLGRRGLYALPIGRTPNHLHVWGSLLGRAGFTLTDIPKPWNAFWAFWCDQVQPAVRQALNREDIWGVGLPMSGAVDTRDQFFQFQAAHEASWLTPDGRLQVDDPAVRAGMVAALRDYTSIWQKGCTPPDAKEWRNIDNNKAFLAQTVVMTANTTLSIPSALKGERPEDYYHSAVTIDWPDDVDGKPLVLDGFITRGVVFKGGGDPRLAREFVRFLAEGGWLAHWLTFAGDRFLPPMRKLLEQPFWLNPNDPHRMRAAIQLLTRPHLNVYEIRDHEWRADQIWQKEVWGNAVHRVVADGVTPEQAVDEAVARIKQILAE
jgi:multiple sugar transport system substrate-binding protein